MSLRVDVCNVAHGDCIHVATPGGRNILLDCGGKGDASASRWLEALGVEGLDCLSISHPHMDHIRDIVRIDENFEPKTLARNKVITRKKIEKENEKVFDDCSEIIEKYLEMNERYNTPAHPADDPTSLKWDGDAYLRRFSNTDPEMGLNNLSCTSFIKYGAHTLLHAGDLEEEGWIELLKDDNFCRQLSKTTVLVASHHGRKNGFCADVFDRLRPRITIVSDGRFRDTSATKRYEEVTTGLEVDGEDRYVLTTRRDKTITVKVVNGRDLKIQCNLVQTADE